MRFVLASISIVTELAGITLPQTTILNGYKHDKGAVEGLAPYRLRMLVAKIR
jgi:hypothetical protein